MTARQRGALLLACGLFLTEVRAEVKYHRMRPTALPGLPCHEYVYGTIEPPRTVPSLTALLVEQRPAPGPGAPPGLVRERVKIFQLPRTSLRLNHCSISQVALTLHENGAWTLSLRGDQNAWMTGPQRDVSTPTQQRAILNGLEPPIPDLPFESGGLKRNQFFVKVRLYGGYPLREAIPAVSPGKPVLVALPTAMFWVQRGYPYDFWARQHDPLVASYFDLIERVEVDFSYR